MNARFLSPDPYVQLPDFSQNFNRYSYALNNPLLYVDPDGEFIHLIIGALVGGVVNLTIKAVRGKIDNVWDGVAAFGIGAVGGAVVAGTGGAALAATGLSGASVLGGVVASTAGFATGGVVQNVGNHIYFGDPIMSLTDFAIGLGISTVTGGIAGGVANKISGKGTNFWTGNKIVDPRISVGTPQIESVVDDFGNSVSGKLDLAPDPIKANYGVGAKEGGTNLAQTPVGRRGNILNTVTKNSPTTINGTKFTGHALDQMQARGILSPSAVLDVIKNPQEHSWEILLAHGFSSGII